MRSLQNQLTSYRYQVALLYAIGLLVTLNACRDSHSPPASNNPLPVSYDASLSDSAKIASVDKVVTDINQALQSGPKIEKYNVHIASDKDIFKYCAMPDNLEEISLNIYYKDSIDVWPVFFMKNGTTAKYRYREWVTTDNPSAMELQLYFDENGELFHATERSIDLEPGQKPVALRKLPMQESTKSKEELLGYYQSYWEQAQHLMETRPGQ